MSWRLSKSSILQQGQSCHSESDSLGDIPSVTAINLPEPPELPLVSNMTTRAATPLLKSSIIQCRSVPVPSASLSAVSLALVSNVTKRAAPPLSVLERPSMRFKAPSPVEHWDELPAAANRTHSRPAAPDTSAACALGEVQSLWPSRAVKLERSSLLHQQGQPLLVTATDTTGVQTAMGQMRGPTESVLAGLAKRPISSAANLQADRIRDIILQDSSQLALKPFDPHRLEQACQQIMQINSWSYSLRTLTQDNSSNWNYWTRWCYLWGTPPVRQYFHSTASQESRMVESFFWSACLPWILGVMSPGPGRQFPLPSSAAAVLRGIRRILITLGFEPPPSSVINRGLKALMNFYVEEHGPEALEPRRCEPIPFDVIIQLVRLVRTANVKLLIGKSKSMTTDGASSLLWRSLEAITAVHTDSGFRKAETTSIKKLFTKKGMSRSNLVWVIAGITLRDPSKEQLLAMVPGDFAMVKPPPSKADQWGIVWGNLPVYLTYDPSQEVDAATSLRALELSYPVRGSELRKATPLFCDNDSKPLTGSFLDAYTKAALVVIGSQVQYSWHSFRAALACRLLAAGATNPEVQALCRWQTEQSLRIYAKMSQPHYRDLLNRAYDQDITQIQFSSLPVYSDLNLARSLNTFELTESFDKD